MAEPLVSIVKGSSNDWEIMQQAARQSHSFGVGFDARVVSAHCAPGLLFDYIKEMAAQGVRCFIAGAANAGLFTIAMPALNDAALVNRLTDFRKQQTANSKQQTAGRCQRSLATTELSEFQCRYY